MPAKGLVLDIETSFMLTYTFSLYPESISHDNIVEDWHIHCACWKWLGKDKVYTAVESNRNDEGVVKKLSKAISEADFIIAHNGVKFDIKKIIARLIDHGLDPIPHIPVVDTLKEARNIAAFSSNRLDYIGQYLDVGRKLHNSPGLWRDAFVGNRTALKKMVEYNIQDVLLLEEIYLELRPYMRKHPNMNVINGEGDKCPKCESPNLEKRGFVHTLTSKKQRYVCNDCGAWSCSGKSLFTSEIR